MRFTAVNFTRLGQGSREQYVEKAAKSRTVDQKLDTRTYTADTRLLPSQNPEILVSFRQANLRPQFPESVLFTIGIRLVSTTTLHQPILFRMRTE